MLPLSRQTPVDLVWITERDAEFHIVIGERPYLSTKIITLSEFFNFVHQVSRL
jgi:hypothetical protein